MHYNKLSPLLNGAIEDLANALEHAQTGSEIDNKYSVIHAATAIELILKEKLRSIGMSIFRKRPPDHSLDYYDYLQALHDKNISVPFESDIELLHKERNSCIHLGAKPDKEKTRWLLSIAKQFMEKFCYTQLNFDISKYLPLEVKSEILSQAERAHMSPAGIYLANAEMAMYEQNYAEAVLNAETAIQLLIKDYLNSRKIEVEPIFQNLMNLIEREKKLPKYLLDTINEVHKLRNNVAHLTVIPDRTTAQKSINLTRIIFEFLQERWKKEKRCLVCGSPAVVGVEKSVMIEMPKIKNKKDLEKAMKKEEGRIIGFYCKNHEPYWATH
jgi:HEPN domain-containing protein